MLSHFLRTVAADDDPNFRNVALLLPGNGTNGAQNNTFLDSSTNNFTITRNGNPTQGTFTPYGPNWSNYFAGSGNYLSVAYNVALALGTGDFTFETWAWANTATLNENQFSLICAGRQDLTASGGGWNIHLFDNAAPTVRLEKCLTNGTAVSFSWTIAASGGLPKNSWNHVAIVRSSGTTTAYWNGVSLGSTAVFNGVDLPIPGSRAIVIASGATPTNQNFWTFSGYLSNMRVVKGSAVYTSAFTPPVAPLTAVTNTSLLTCQSNRFRDTSSNNFTISVVGTPPIQRFSPFNLTGPYESTVIGGSGYFDGTDDFLSFTGASFSGQTALTIEMWVYPLITPNGEAVYAEQYTGAGDAVAAAIFFGNNTAPLTGSGAFLQVGTFTGSAWVNTTGTTLTLNAWSHIAAVYSSSTWKLYVNGTLIATSGTVTLPADNDVTYIARRWDTAGTRNYFGGYISNVRVVRGTAVYTGNFTPPTAPVTAITNTSLLLNYTNAGIIDNAMMNDLETVGNAQISTAQSVFGGSSMLFDGTGDVAAVPYTTAGAMNLLKPWGSGSYTLECWLRFTSVALGQHIFIGYTSTTSGTASDFAIYIPTNGSLAYYLSSTGTTWNLANGVSVGAIATNQWYHFAFVKNGNTWTPYLNGVAGTSTTTATTIFQNALPFSVGGMIGGGAGSAMSGYIDDVRVTKGIARYTANFTPPVRPFPTQ